MITFMHSSRSQENLANIFTPQILSSESNYDNNRNPHYSGTTYYQLKLKAAIDDSKVIISKASFYFICEKPDRSISTIRADSIVNIISNWYELYFSITSPKGWMDVALSRDTINFDNEIKHIPISNKLSVLLK